MKRKHIALALPILLAATPASATGIDFGLNAGTLGAGPQLGITIVPDTFRARLATGFLDYSDTVTADEIEYSGDLKLRNAALIGDYHPFGGVFRLSAGAVLNANEFSATGTVIDGTTYTADGVSYTASAGDSVNADVDFDAVAPYVGIGWGSAGRNSGLSLSADIGVMFQGSPSASIDIETSNASVQAQADQYAARAESDLNDELDGFELYPVVQLGAIYRF